MFIGRNLENVRMLNGLSRKELSEKIHVSEQAIWQYETKNMMPEINKIYDISDMFNVRTAYFINEQPNEFKADSVNKQSIAFRAKNHKVSTKLLSKQYYQATYLSNLTAYLFSYIKAPNMPILNIVANTEKILCSNIDVANRKSLIKKVASLTRNMLMKEKSNRELLFELEKSGVIIYEKGIDNEADAFSFWSKNGWPFIILGSNKGVAVRRNFDIAHELGHIILHRNIQFDILSTEEYKKVENEADIFASEFLLPETEFITDFSNLNKKSNPDYFKLLKEKWFVSIQAIGMRAYYLGLMSETQYRYFWATINKKGYKKQEPLDNKIDLAKPVKINSLLKLYFDNDILTPDKLINELNVESEFLNKIAGIDLNLFQQYINQSKEQNVLNLFI